jgi:hypothetical protein
MGSGPTTRLAWVAQRSRAAHARRTRPAPTVVAAHRFDHLPITGRSRGQRLVHPSITRHSMAPQGAEDGIPRGDTAALAGCGSHPSSEGSRLGHAKTWFGSLDTL